MLENPKTSILSLFKNCSPYVLVQLAKMPKLLGWTPWPGVELWLLHMWVFNYYCHFIYLLKKNKNCSHKCFIPIPLVQLDHFVLVYNFIHLTFLKKCARHNVRKSTFRWYPKWYGRIMAHSPLPVTQEQLFDLIEKHNEWIWYLFILNKRSEFDIV